MQRVETGNDYSVAVVAGILKLKWSAARENQTFFEKAFSVNLNASESKVLLKRYLITLLKVSAVV